MPILPQLRPEIKVYESRTGAVRHYVLPLRSTSVLHTGVTVRIGPSGVLLCLSCLRPDCDHVARVADFHREYERLAAEAEASS